MKFLHVGCGSLRKESAGPGFHSDEWVEIRVDIDPGVKPDVVANIVDMSAVMSGSVDAVFSSHNLEHLYAHEIPLALAEFFRVLSPLGFAVITCPDLQEVCRVIAEGKLLETAYHSPAGPIAPLDILFGHRPSLARGNTNMAHRCGFTLPLLMESLRHAGFTTVAGTRRLARFDLWVLGSKVALEEPLAQKMCSEHFPRL